MNPQNCIFFDSCIFQSFLLADEPFAKVLQSFETCLLVDYIVWERLVSSLDSPTAFHERFRFTRVPFFPDLNLLSYE